MSVLHRRRNAASTLARELTRTRRAVARALASAPGPEDAHELRALSSRL